MLGLGNKLKSSTSSGQEKIFLRCLESGLIFHELPNNFTILHAQILKLFTHSAIVEV